MAEIDYKLVSPSRIGLYAACTDRLRRDSISPPAYRSNAAADFGTVCHYEAMRDLGAIGCETLKPPKEDQINLAATLFSDKHAMQNQAKKCAQLANTRVPKLPEGIKWRCEVSQYDQTLLPKRVNRDGGTGYGGSIDLLATDDSVLLDYKFVGKIPGIVKVEYLWQMGSYSLLRDVNETILLFTTRDCRTVATISFKWKADPKWKRFRDQIRSFIDRIGHANFANYCYPMAGEHCEYCDHRDDCPAFNQPRIVTDIQVPAAKTDSHALATLTKLMGIKDAEAKPKPVAIDSKQYF